MGSIGTKKLFDPRHMYSPLWGLKKFFLPIFFKIKGWVPVVVVVIEAKYKNICSKGCGVMGVNIWPL